MWITDTCYRDGTVEIWERGEAGAGTHHRTVDYSPPFCLHLPDPHSHWELIDALAASYRVDECTFNTIYGGLEGWRIYAGRDVADAIERQTRFSARIYNADLRADQRYMAEQGLVPCAHETDMRFSTDFSMPFRVMEVTVRDNPFGRGPVSCMDVICEGQDRLEGSEKAVITGLSDLIGSCDPDVILFPLSDLWLPRILAGARRYSLDTGISRSGRFRKMQEKTYMSYGRTEYRAGSLIPDGRILIDTRQSFNYRESGLSGIVLGARLTGLCPNMAARFTSGTLISSYEVYEAIRRGIAVPYRKNDPECLRRMEDLKRADRGGMMFQPCPGLYGDVYQIDFTSLYPSVIVKYNLSPETLACPGRPGFLPEVLAPLLALRRETKQKKGADPSYAGPDSLLKWMLVTCFGYTGYKNAKFGRIEVHELITGHSRDILLSSRDIAEEMGFSVIHGIVDCLWVQGKPADQLKVQIERSTALHTTLDTYDWIVFLPMPDGFGAYNRYYGRLAGGKPRVRGIMARRRDTPGYVKAMQADLIALMCRAPGPADLTCLEEEARERYARASEGLCDARPDEMAIRRQISRLDYSRRCPEASAVKACLAAGIDPAPGMEIGYVVTDSRTWEVELEWKAAGFDVAYYRGLLDKAWEEVAFAFREAEKQVSCPVGQA